MDIQPLTGTDSWSVLRRVCKLAGLVVIDISDLYLLLPVIGLHCSCNILFMLCLKTVMGFRLIYYHPVACLASDNLRR